MNGCVVITHVASAKVTVTLLFILLIHSQSIELFIFVNNMQVWNWVVDKLKSLPGIKIES